MASASAVKKCGADKGLLSKVQICAFLRDQKKRIIQDAYAKKNVMNSPENLGGVPSTVNQVKAKLFAETLAGNSDGAFYATMFFQ